MGVKGIKQFVRRVPARDNAVLTKTVGGPSVSLWRDNNSKSDCHTAGHNNAIFLRGSFEL
ncbi:hypothetical protein CCHR01_02581 [Colletotrichum chrysophilum]|uniref:Uncharacterized protein n=1 Tax=Colletotrichum chrysophilum TaxID=1836956 RepID=A0AAD9AY20_9PEZI|nr:hypothetical protein CCHR01_02581 [Colletotrichum chrysophilum]